MWAELERFIRLHAKTSEQHKKVLDCLLDCKGSTIDPFEKIGVKDEKDEKDK